MGAGKYLAIVAGLLTILGTYLFAITGVSGGIVAGSGIGVFQNLSLAFEFAEVSGLLLGGTVVVYILIILMIIFAISGFIQLAGIKSRAVIGIFSIFPLLIGIFVILFSSSIIDTIQIDYMLALTREVQIVEGAIPFILEINDGLALGTILILAGGFLGIVSAALPREDIY